MASKNGSEQPPRRRENAALIAALDAELATREVRRAEDSAEIAAGLARMEARGARLAALASSARENAKRKESLDSFRFQEFAPELLKEFLDAREAYATALAAHRESGKARAKEERERTALREGYFAARNSLLYAATQHSRPDRPVTAIMRESYRDKLAQFFFSDEQRFFHADDPEFDSVEGALRDEALVRTYASRVPEGYDGPSRPFLGDMVSLPAEVVEKTIGEEAARKLTDARIKHFVARFAEAGGAPVSAGKEAHERYALLRRETMRKMVEAKLTERSTKGEILIDLWKEDVSLETRIRGRSARKGRRPAPSTHAKAPARARTGKALRVAAALLATAPLGADTVRTSLERDSSIQRPSASAPVMPGDGGLWQPSPEKRTQPERSFIPADITPEKGAIGALEVLSRNASKLPWLSAWAEGRTPASLAKELQLLVYPGERLTESGHSAVLPKHSWMRANREGIRLYYPDGNSITLLEVDSEGRVSVPERSWKYDPPLQEP